MSELVFTADTDGVAVNLSSANAWLRSDTANLSGASFHKAGAVLDAGNGDGGARQAQLENIVARGAGGNFQNGIVLNKSAPRW